MLRSRLWGRPPWSWALDAALLAVVLILLATATNPTVRTLAVVLLAWRIISVAVGVLVWRLRTRDGRRG